MEMCTSSNKTESNVPMNPCTVAAVDAVNSTDAYLVYGSKGHSFYAIARTYHCLFSHFYSDVQSRIVAVAYRVGNSCEA